jgi:hypothetical protein
LEDEREFKLFSQKGFDHAEERKKRKNEQERLHDPGQQDTHHKHRHFTQKKRQALAPVKDQELIIFAL